MITSIRILYFKEGETNDYLIKNAIDIYGLSFELKCVKNKQDFTTFLLHNQPDLVLCDYIASNSISEEVLTLTKKTKQGIPFILLAHSITEEALLNFMKLDLDDFVPFNLLQSLPRSIENTILKRKIIQERRDASQRITAQGEYLSVLIENSDQTVIICDKNYKITYSSPAVTKVLGWTGQDLKKNSFLDYVYPDDAETCKKCFHNLNLSSVTPLPINFRIRHKNGETILIEGTMSMLLDKEDMNTFVVNYHEITSKKVAEDLLQKSEANLRTIFDNTSVSYVLSDRKFQVISFNKSAVAIYKKEFKIKLQEGDNLLNYLPEERKVISKERFERALKGEKVNYELNFPKADGSNTWYNVNMFAIRDASNTLLGFIISSEEITQRKIIELERIKMISDTVQHNKDLEQFSYIISHNLRSPVANIIGLSNIIKKETNMNEKDFAKCIDGLELSATKLDEIIVDLNHILQQRREINEKKDLVNFSNLLTDIKTILSSQIEKENINIHSDFTINHFFTVRSYLHSIFLNILTNSIKYRNPAVSSSIFVSSKKVHNKLILTFKDNGLGIDLQNYGNELFGLYKRFHSHTEGKGMGLYMVKTQVEILGGKITATSQVAKGTEFTIEFSADYLPSIS